MNNLEKFKENLGMKLFGRSRELAQAENSCVKCGGRADTFRDEVSKREYGISKFCQQCQDEFFGVPEE